MPIVAGIDREEEAAAKGGVAETTRRCVVTGDCAPKFGLLRLAVSPQGLAVPDVDERLPGRGIWVTSDRNVIGRLNVKAASRSAKRRVAPIDGLGDLAERQMAARCVSLIGLARRGGAAVAGFQKVMDFMKRGTGAEAIVLEATDAGDDGRAKVASAALGAHIRVVLTGVEIGQAFGRGSIAHALVSRGGVARKLMRELTRLEGLRRAR